MHRFDEVPGSAAANPFAARGAVVQLRGDALQYVFDQRPCFRRTSRHDRRAVQGPFLPAGDPRSDEIQSPVFDLFHAPGRILKGGVASVDNYVSRFHQRRQLRDQFVDRFPGPHHHHDPARTPDRSDQLADRVRAREPFPVAASCDETVDDAFFARRRPIVDRHAESFAFHVQREIFTHYGQADQSDIRFFHSFREF